MKKMLPATALWPRLLQDVLNGDVYRSKQTGSSKYQSENHHPSFLRF